MKRLICCVLMLVMATALFAGCGEKKLTDAEYLELAKEKAEENKKKVGLYITKGDTTHEITMDKLVYFLAYYEKQGLEYFNENKEYFDNVYSGEYDYWSITSGSNGETMKDNYKNMAFSTAVYTYLMYLEAVENGMELSEVRKAQLDTLTAEFVAGFTAQQRARCGMTEECIRENYERILLADAYVTQLQEGHEPDEEAIKATVDKEDYRVYVSDYLYVSKFDYNDDFTKIELSEDEMTARKEAIENALVQTEKGQTMMSIQVLYNEFMTYATRDFYRTNVTYEEDYIETAMSLEPDECVLLETSTGYYVIKLISNDQIVGYEEAVQDALDNAQAVDVATLYQEIEKEYEVTKAEAWDAVSFGSYALIPTK